MIIKHTIMITVITCTIVGIFITGIVGGAVGISGVSMVLHWVMDGVEGDNFRSK